MMVSLSIKSIDFGGNTMIVLMWRKAIGGANKGECCIIVIWYHKLFDSVDNILRVGTVVDISNRQIAITNTVCYGQI